MKFMHECVKTTDEWIAIQQKLIRSTNVVSTNDVGVLPVIVKSGNCFILRWEDERDMVMFLLRWV